MPGAAARSTGRSSDWEQRQRATARSNGKEQQHLGALAQAIAAARAAARAAAEALAGSSGEKLQEALAGALARSSGHSHWPEQRPGAAARSTARGCCWGQRPGQMLTAAAPRRCSWQLLLDAAPAAAPVTAPPTAPGNCSRQICLRQLLQANASYKCFRRTLQGGAPSHLSSQLLGPLLRPALHAIAPGNCFW